VPRRHVAPGPGQRRPVAQARAQVFSQPARKEQSDYDYQKHDQYQRGHYLSPVAGSDVYFYLSARNANSLRVKNFAVGTTRSFRGVRSFFQICVPLVDNFTARAAILPVRSWGERAGGATQNHTRTGSMKTLVYRLAVFSLMIFIAGLPARA
jgi:hypothetical protein